MLKAVVFDFYGVIYSNFDWNAIDERIYTDPEKAIEFRRAMRHANLGEISNEEFLKTTSNLAEDTKYPEKQAVNFKSSINYSALRLIENLRSRYKIGLLSNGGHAHIKNALAEVGGESKYFDVVVSSSDTRHIKPAADAFFNIVERLGAQPQTTLIVDDSPGHIAGAVAAGLQAIRFSDMKSLRVELRKIGVECA